MNETMPQGIITKDGNVFAYLGAEVERVPMGEYGRLPIPQCVWITTCGHCTKSYYGDHKPEALDLLKAHFYEEHHAA
jgi:hypothetical protein